MSAFLSAQGASYHWRGRALVDAATLDVALGSVTIVIGQNGAGKSTLLRLLSGELTPTAGSIACDGIDVRRQPPWRLACKRSVMTQAPQLSFPFTVHEVARLGLEGVGKGLARQRRRDVVAQCLEIAEVSPLAGRRYETLPGGEQRRVQFARALAQLEAGRTVSERQALLLDEPIANLDLRHQILLLDAARSAAARGVAVLAVLHDLKVAARYADTLAIMRAGVIVACGAPLRIMTPELLSQVFDIDLAVATSGSQGNLSIVPASWGEREDGRLRSL